MFSFYLVNSATDDKISNIRSDITKITAVSRQDALEVAIRYLKEKWPSFTDNTMGMSPISAGSPMTGCVYYKLNNDYGCAIFMSYFIYYPAFIRLYDGEWQGFVRF